jgi:methionine-rich copper-binding protein CopC
MRHLPAMTAALVFVSATAFAAPPRPMDSKPRAETIIHGRHSAYVVRFDQPIDHAASRLEIRQGDKIVENLRPRLDSAPDVLFAASETPSAGHYVLYWRARSANGETSEGSIPFSTSP